MSKRLLARYGRAPDAVEPQRPIGGFICEEPAYPSKDSVAALGSSAVPPPCGTARKEAADAPTAPRPPRPELFSTLGTEPLKRVPGAWVRNADLVWRSLRRHHVAQSPKQPRGQCRTAKSTQHQTR